MKTKEKKVGVYYLKHKPSGKFYIGATQDLDKRWASHVSRLKNGKHHKNIQAVYNTTNDINDWSIRLVESCKKSQLNKTEQKYVTKHFSNPLCLNKNSGVTSGRRDIKLHNNGKHHLAISLLGKNSRDGILRPADLTFIDPDGKEYTNIVSVKSFAEEHNLSQVLMNNLANGKSASYMGWTRKNSELPIPANVYEYWSKERMLAHYPEYQIIDPDGNIHRTFVLAIFEERNNCTVMTELKHRYGTKLQTRGLTKYGKGWRLSHVPTFRCTLQDGRVYEDIISLPKWAEGIGMNPKRLQYYLSKGTRKTAPRRGRKRGWNFTLEKIIP